MTDPLWLVPTGYMTQNSMETLWYHQWPGPINLVCHLRFTKPWCHGFVAGYILEPITVHDTEVLRNFIGQSKVTGHQAMGFVKLSVSILQNLVLDDLNINSRVWNTSSYKYCFITLAVGRKTICNELSVIATNYITDLLIGKSNYLQLFQ